ncbi:MAG: aspartate/tyrosine/aromatic aminotransferase [Gammaproteobacteria bacterium]|nr:aspartate/tyrosine/aromatic aminotransferase [Gammaproteobacteria bacterium]
MEKEDITQHEIEALKTEYNLADAHTHQSQSGAQLQIIQSLPELWYRAEAQTQYQSEQEFIESFYRLHGQYTALERKQNIYLVYAASIGMHITATYLMQHQMRVGLIEPCFDNLHDLMKHMRIPMSPLEEEIFHDTSTIYGNLMKKAVVLDAIVLVDPNNPTGFSLFADGPEAFVEVVRFCTDFNKLLVLDFSFSAFILASGGKRYDIYEILENSGVSYIAMEDTGKTWPMQDAKCSTILASKDLDAHIYPIVTSVLLNVSPFVLNLVTKYVQASEADNFKTVAQLLNRNRKTAKEMLDGDVLSYCEPRIKTSVAWFEIKDQNVSADYLHNHLLQYKVYVLSGKYFYWHNPAKGQRYIRIALARDSEVFDKAMQVMREALNEL